MLVVAAVVVLVTTPRPPPHRLPMQWGKVIERRDADQCKALARRIESEVCGFKIVVPLKDVFLMKYLLHMLFVQVSCIMY